MRRASPLVRLFFAMNNKGSITHLENLSNTLAKQTLPHYHLFFSHNRVSLP